MIVLNGSEIDEVVIEGNERVVIKLRDGLLIVVKPDTKKVRDIYTVYDGSESVDVRVYELDDKTHELCKSQAFLEISIKSGKKNISV